MGWFLKLTAVIILTVILFDVGGFIKWKVRIILWVGTAFEFIPVVSAMPIYLLSIMWAHFKIKNRAEESRRKAEKIIKS